MRILLVSQELPPETGWGGIGTYVRTISRALAAKGHEVHALSVVEGQQASCRQIEGVTVHRQPLPLVHRPSRRAPETWRRTWLPAVVAWLTWRSRIAPDVVECPEWMAEGLGLALAGRIPLVVHLHSSARQVFPLSRQGGHLRGLDGRAAIWLEEAAVRQAHAVISTPWNLAEWVERLDLSPEVLHPLWYPLEPKERLPTPDSGRPQVTFLGRFEPRKGPDVLMAAIPAVLAEVPNATFAFVGRDGMAPGLTSSSRWLRAQAQLLGVANAVDVREQFGQEAVRAALREATVCAFPSRWESFGYTVAEAQGAGRPVVVSSIPALRALVQDGVSGAVAAGDDPRYWAPPLVDLLRDPARAAAMGNAGAARVAALTNPSRVADETVGVYEAARERWRHSAAARRSRRRQS